MVPIRTTASDPLARPCNPKPKPSLTTTVSWYTYSSHTNPLSRSARSQGCQLPHQEPNLPRYIGTLGQGIVYKPTNHSQGTTHRTFRKEQAESMLISLPPRGSAHTRPRAPCAEARARVAPVIFSLNGSGSRESKYLVLGSSLVVIFGRAEEATERGS